MSGNERIRVYLTLDFAEICGSFNGVPLHYHYILVITYVEQLLMLLMLALSSSTHVLLVLSLYCYFLHFVQLININD